MLNRKGRNLYHNLFEVDAISLLSRHLESDSLSHNITIHKPIHTAQRAKQYLHYDHRRYGNLYKNANEGQNMTADIFIQISSKMKRFPGKLKLPTRPKNRQSFIVDRAHRRKDS